MPTHSNFPLRTELFEYPNFPIHDTLMPGESGPGFIIRMAQKNHVGYYELMRHINFYQYPYITNNAATMISPLFGLKPKCIARVTADHYKIYGQCHTRLNGFIFRKSYLVRQRHPQICHLCIEEKLYSQLVWDLSLYTACVEHKICLIDHCSSCGKSLTWARNKLSVCGCGKPFFGKHNKSSIASEFQLFVSSVIKSKFTDDLSEPISNNSLLKLSDGLSLDIFLRLIWSFGLHTAPMLGRLSHGKQILNTSATIDLVNHAITRINHAIYQNSISTIKIAINKTSLNDVLEDSTHQEFNIIHFLLDKVSALESIPGIRNSNMQKQLLLFADNV
ncbi:TniQ family protein [Polynucleobacter sp. AM-7D1]|uniref:TniQ family protein n=1 Tax=Polynucleobacter sp. AM-7D1 TaxID=2689102 RepID=UPI001BFEEAD9|nr:TniQ family protein [Polynucleobacter sp. AM-7D1]QWE28475.1 TniQ family protein [Polynucleobacter sp. AM-7D1]